MQMQVQRARELYARSALGVPALKGFGSQRVVRLMSAVYGGILGAIEAQGYDVFAARGAPADVGQAEGCCKGVPDAQPARVERRAARVGGVAVSRLITRVPAQRSSRLSGFHRLSIEQRRAALVEAGWVSPAMNDRFSQPSTGFTESHADAMVENVIGTHGLPLGVALNFQLNGVDRLVPMAVEEPSIIAACSNAARMVREGGGFVGEADAPVLTAQVQLTRVANLAVAVAAIREARAELLRSIDALMPQMVARGGGARDLDVRVLSSDALCVHLHLDTRDAFGANLASLVAEKLAPRLAELAGAQAGLKILTNLSDRRKVYLRATVPVSALVSARHPSGEAVRDRIVEAQRFAEMDVYRAVTHNKGVMNGVDAVLVACGNDWRAVEAGAHAWASRNGRYEPLTRWEVNPDGALEGELVMPLAASIVGGAARAHGGVRAALEVVGASSSVDLAMIAAAAGLASNLAALRALSTDGITEGHLALHARQVAAEAGAVAAEIELVAAQLSQEQVYRPERAVEILGRLRGQTESDSGRRTA